MLRPQAKVQRAACHPAYNGPRADHIRNHRSDRRHAGGRSGSEKTGDQAWDRLLHEATTSREGEGEVHVPGQVTVEASWQRLSERDRCQYFRIGGSRSLELTEENLRRFESARRTPGQTPSLLPIKAKARPVGPQPPPGPPPGWQGPVGDRPEETASPAGTKPKEPASPISVDPEKMLAVIAQTEIPEPKTPPIPGPKTPPTPTTRPKAKSRPLTEEQKAVADKVLAQKARDLLKAAERGTGTLREEKASTASGSGAKRVPKYLAHLTDEEREQLFRSELASERQAGAIEWEKELARQAKEEEERRKAKALYRSERMAQALEHGKEVQRRRQEEFEKGKQDLLQWRAEEEDRENLRKARRISLEQPAVPPTAGGVVLTPAPTAALEENPSTPPEALQAPLSEEEIAYRKGASVQVFGQEGRREVGRDVRIVGRGGRHDIQSVQVPPKRGVEPPIRARAHFSNPAFDVVRKKEIVCTVESEPEFEFEYPIKLRGNRLAKHILQSHTPYDPSCAVCLMSKGLKRAPKPTDQVTNEIQMYIANLCTHPKSPNMYRYVVMWNRTHGMTATAAIYVDQASTIRVLTAAINHCSSTGAMVLSDEGRDLTALISELIRLKVVSRHETSRPGRHATGAERAVRTLKTQLGCIRTALYQHGLMLVKAFDTLQQTLVMSTTHFSCKPTVR